MRCDEYDDDLIDVAAGAAASSGLAAHLADCVDCRNRVVIDRTVLAGFEVELRGRLDAKPSSAMRDRIKDRVAAEAPMAWPFGRVGSLAAGLAAVLVAGWAVSRPLPAPRPLFATVPPKTADVAPKKADSFARDSPAPPLAVRRVVTARQRPARELAAARGEPSVLVLPGQEEALRRFVVALREDPLSSRPLLMTAAPVDSPMEPPPLLAIPPLDVPPLPAVERSSS